MILSGLLYKKSTLRIKYDSQEVGVIHHMTHKSEALRKLPSISLDKDSELLYLTW